MKLVANCRAYLGPGHHPKASHEQAGWRPAIVISPRAYNDKVGLALRPQIPFDNVKVGIESKYVLDFHGFQDNKTDSIDVGKVLIRVFSKNGRGLAFHIFIRDDDFQRTCLFCFFGNLYVSDITIKLVSKSVRLVNNV